MIRRYLRLSAKYNLDASSQNRPHLPLVSEIRITRKKKGKYRGSDGIYTSTVHELTHAGHREMDTYMFDFLSNGNKQRLLMRESWAEGVETILTNDRYKALDVGYLASNRYNNTNLRFWNDNRQAMTIDEMNEYAPLIADLIDKLDQSNLPNILGVQPIDRVSGYTLYQIQFALNNSRNLQQWKQKLKWNVDNPTEHRLDELFEYVNEVYKSL